MKFKNLKFSNSLNFYQPFSILNILQTGKTEHSIYFSRAPLGTSSKKVAKTGPSFSPTEAANSIPLESKPLIFRG